MPRQDFTFSHPLRVRWAEADMQGVVFNGHYLLYFDVAATEYWRVVTGGDQAVLRATFDRLQVVNSTVDYHAPARFDDLLDVCARTARLGRSSMRMAFEIHRGDQLLISGHNVYVHIDGNRPVRVPDGLRDLVRRFERLAPEA